MRSFGWALYNLPKYVNKGTFKQSLLPHSASLGGMVDAFEGKFNRASVVLHGKAVRVKHDAKTIFKKIENPMIAGTYNSLSASDVPYSFEVSARSENDVVMGVRHKECFVEGIQFDPSSILTVEGNVIIENLIREVGKE